MLRSLYIKNFILVDELSVDFNSGFNVFTGETGAGKSIIINAISLLLNKRSSASYVQNNKDKALIEAMFDLNDNMKTILDENGIDHDDDMILTREIKKDGKSTFRLNHRVVNGSMVEQIMQNTIDIHSQHDTQYLLNKNKHIDLLDRYLKTDLNDIVKSKYQLYSSLKKELEDTLNTKFNTDDLDYFRYVVDEIDNANLSAEEEDELKLQEKRYLEVKNNLTKYEMIKKLFNENIYDNLYEICKLIKGFNIENIDDNLNNALALIEDAIEQLDNYVSDFYVDEETINNIQKRLFDISKLKHKYGNSIEQILAYKKELEEKIANFENRNEYIAIMQKKVDKAYQDYLDSANKLHDLRVKKAKELEIEVLKHLKDLMLNNAQFKISIEKDKPNTKGIDNVEFMVSMNLGEQLKPLHKVASGGELSRLMLGLKVIFAKLANVETIIFDEIDTGVSGKVASAIGNKMLQISKDIQLFAITHSSLVACQADHHYKVIKEVKDNNTYTNLITLNDQQRIEEIAMMASGTIDEQAINLAKQLLQRT